MGFLTTFTIYNDGVDLVKKYPQEFAEAVYKAALDNDRPGNEMLSVGYFSNLLTAQKPRHADDHTCYIHMGNTVCEMNSYSTITNEMLEMHPEYFEKMLRFMSEEVRKLKQKLKDRRAKDDNKNKQ